jgi:hypothetical protein
MLPKLAGKMHGAWSDCSREGTPPCQYLPGHEQQYLEPAPPAYASGLVHGDPPNPDSDILQESIEIRRRVSALLQNCRVSPTRPLLPSPPSPDPDAPPRAGGEGSGAVRSADHTPRWWDEIPAGAGAGGGSGRALSEGQAYLQELAARMAVDAPEPPPARPPSAGAAGAAGAAGDGWTRAPSGGAEFQVRRACGRPRAREGRRAGARRRGPRAVSDAQLSAVAGVALRVSGVGWVVVVWQRNARLCAVRRAAGGRDVAAGRRTWRSCASARRRRRRLRRRRPRRRRRRRRRQQQRRRKRRWSRLRRRLRRGS